MFSLLVATAVLIMYCIHRGIDTGWRYAPHFRQRSFLGWWKSRVFRGAKI